MIMTKTLHADTIAGSHREITATTIKQTKRRFALLRHIRNKSVAIYIHTYIYVLLYYIVFVYSYCAIATTAQQKEAWRCGANVVVDWYELYIETSQQIYAAQVDSREKLREQHILNELWHCWTRPNSIWIQTQQHNSNRKKLFSSINTHLIVWKFIYTHGSRGSPSA